MKQKKLWRTCVAVSISALAFPAFVQSQTNTGGSSTSGIGGSSHSATGTMGMEETPGVTGSSRMGEGLPSPDSGMSTAEQSRSSVMSDQAMTETDLALNQKLRQELASDSDLSRSASRIHFHTDNGKVTLQGMVATEQEKQDIENKVEKITGVKDVDNQLQIASTSSNFSSDMGSGSNSRSGESGAMGSAGGTATR